MTPISQANLHNETVENLKWKFIALGLHDPEGINQMDYEQLQ